MKVVTVLALFFASVLNVYCQFDLKSISKEVKVPTSPTELSASLSTEQVVEGLKEALDKGTTEAVEKCSGVDGFYKNPALFIPTPSEAEKAKSYAQKMGLNKQVDDFELSLNRAAEEAAKSATPIVVSAIKNMSVEDAWGILKGEDDAATQYLQTTTKDSLYNVFLPIVKSSIEKVHVAEYWNPIMISYNKTTTFSRAKKVNPDLDKYITEKTMEGLFKLIAVKELDIRKNTASRTTDVLKDVFAQQD